MMSFANAVWHIWLEMAPWLLLGMAIAGFIHVVIPKNFISRALCSNQSTSVVTAV